MTLYSIVLVCMLLLVFPALFTMSLVFFKLPLVLFRHIFPEELHNLIGAQLTKIQVTYGETTCTLHTIHITTPSLVPNITGISLHTTDETQHKQLLYSRDTTHGGTTSR